MSGLIVDVFGDLAVIASSAAWVEKYKQQIKACISRLIKINHISWRPSIDILKEEGLNLSDSIEDDSCVITERVKVTLLTYLHFIPTISSPLMFTPLFHYLHFMHVNLHEMIGFRISIYRFVLTSKL